MLSFWLSFCLSLFRVLKPSLDGKVDPRYYSERDIVGTTDWLIEENHSSSNSNSNNNNTAFLNKFVHQLADITFEIFSLLLFNINRVRNLFQCLLIHPLYLNFSFCFVLLPSLPQEFEDILMAIVITNLAKSTTSSNSLTLFSNLLAGCIKSLKKNHLPEPVIQYLFQQVFSYIDVQLFNGFLKQPVLYSASNAFKVKMALSQVENAVGKVDKKLMNIVR